MRLFAAVLVVASLLSRNAWGDDEDRVHDAKSGSARSGEKGGVQIDYATEEETAPVEESTYFKSFEQVIQNPALLSSLAGGAEELNRSLVSLMDSVFYSLLDNEKNFYVNKNTWFNALLKRDVYSTTAGSFVVVDQMSLGPRYSKELYRVHNVPISLGIDGSVDVLQIYLRNDGMRLAEQAGLPRWRRWLNNWFGIVPGLALILPPSFNQNELYDPLREVETPFVFPLSAEAFGKMPIGSIRSYAISGGVQLSADIGGALDKSSKDLLYKIGQLDETLPYAIFKRGEHRINVLRRDENIAWVGLKDLKRTGHVVSPFVGKKYNVLQGALAATIFKWHWVWQGVPIGVFPLNLNFEQAIADLYDQIYEYDMRNPQARAAYEAAVRGDFVPSRQRYLDTKEKGVATGVAFQFTRTQRRHEELSHNGPNLAVYRRDREAGHDKAEVEITDTEGKFYILEATRDIVDKEWNVLTPEEQRRVQGEVAIKVRKVVSKDHPEDPTDYTFAYDTDPDPIGMQVTLGIQDRYVDVAEFDQYIRDLRYFTALPLDEIPSIPLKDVELQRERRQAGFFASPKDNVALLHVPATYLGQFGAQAIVHFSTKQLDRILARSLDEKWGAYAAAFGVDVDAWKDPARRNTLLHGSQWFKAFLLYPFRLFNWRFPTADAIKEATEGISRMDEIKGIAAPREKIGAFYELLGTDHPERLARVLLLLSDIDKVPRKVTLTAQPKGAARAEIKQQFGKTNNLVFTGGPALPVPTRYARAKNKLANFYLDQPRDAENKPKVARVLVTTREVPGSVRSLPEATAPEDEAAPPGEPPILRDERHVFLSVAVAKIDPRSPIKLFVRVEQAGRIKFGKLALAEKVLELLPADAAPGGSLSSATYDFFLTGPMSPLSGFMFDKAMEDGDELRVTLAASRDGAVWSDERIAEFRFERGRLEPIK